ncbi:hypothetical protein SAMN04487897_10442 [Paenibacillus sp. yr247]|uniref:hypothetical protein n=1 Tax=Paenibacillus sp. yr247 TaxID=1761880 RepID=UPI00089000D4|nr:hypothetical protein [Paenibacillus sp. yr247]SDN67533.1 hypothetical protein SAMN04487897_10442 [Paenibacillus sp. yr247]
MNKVIQNVNVLDITTAAEQALDGVSKIKNVNLLLYSKATIGLLANVAQKNINVQAEIPEGGKLHMVNDRYEVGAAPDGGSPLYLVVNGTLIIRPDADAESLERGIAGIIVNGTIFCPEGVFSIVQQKIVQHNGRLALYMDNALLISDPVHIDDLFLRTLPSDSRVSFSGKAVLLDADAALLEEKLRNMEFTGELVIREQLLAALSGKLVNAHKAKIVTIPADTYYIDRDLTLDAGVLRRLPHRRIHATGLLRFELDVTPERLAAAVDRLHSERAILCPVELKDSVLAVTADPAVEVLSYAGKLRVVEGEYRLTPNELKYSPEPLSFIVNGVLDIAAEIDPQLLFDSIESIVNYGVISGNGEQYGVVQTKLIKNEGAFDVRRDEEVNDEPDEASAKDDTVYIRNVNYLKL